MESFSSIEELIESYKDVPFVKKQIEFYLEQNQAATKFVELSNKENWPLRIDHLTIRTFNIDKAAKQYQVLGWQFSEQIEYKKEGWFAKIYHHPKYAPFFIDQSYEDASPELKIVQNWVNFFGDKEFHHIAFTLPNQIEIEEAIQKMEEQMVTFPGQITGQKGSRLRQVFSKAENYKGKPFSVLEIAERNEDPATGKIYEGFISEQADNLMKDSLL
ncbi:MAG TPA: VOC family protein [Vampirovibrionales bacterium]